jgi:phage terminase small subunit
MAKDKAPDRQAQFAQEYVVDFNGKQAAIRSGYSKKTAESQASRLLRNVKVRSEIERLLEDPVGRRNEIRKRNIDELLPLAYTDAAVELKRDKDGNVIEVSFRDKLRAIELLGKMHGLFTDKVDVALCGSLNVVHDLSKLTEEELEQLEKLTGKIENTTD